MFEYILGKLAVKKIDYVALEINGLAYKIHISLKTFEKIGNIGNDEKLYIFTNVKEDDISLYGFKTQNERELFKALISISGVGPKLAIAILSTFTGLGIKKAQKIILDLKDKVKKIDISEMLEETSNLSNGKLITSESFDPKILLMKEDLKLALESLGYTNTDISKWIKDSELAQLKDISEAIKIVLQKIQNKK